MQCYFEWMAQSPKLAIKLTFSDVCIRYMEDSRNLVTFVCVLRVFRFPTHVNFPLLTFIYDIISWFGHPIISWCCNNQMLISIRILFLLDSLSLILLTLCLNVSVKINIMLVIEDIIVVINLIVQIYWHKLKKCICNFKISNLFLF